ncbi:MULTISPECIES: MarR family winged helix-turn-helix transcriptional regulator [unclassified Bosea (in: a-proteobacteria)]|uniref:MarR family winged helix-turn-helix transcriptional regulator n=1 Tax=unclassified Bosea (in: a-proteobacteria) TaxID=2653178 RepID=UPI000F76244F|nr:MULTISPECIES: MarR family winged helix-turn-helix transcriptional regulator [unclassified Bosea (in: a-proteobacteria)]AZO78007.1 MarR family transcriptional regulator [Bosea sp. Tri-49]RXT19233.1 MarR family transcriptional regulator [Bosea sp. Tri-39]RXT41505.1 MarR family transcriptional regulator [Bosea sp. Tri-54]
MTATLAAAEISESCFCMNLRKAARLIARRYDEALRPLGLTSGQFSILAALLRPGPVPLGALADVLGMERTTLNRNLRPLEKLKLVETIPDPADARVRGLRLTGAGREMAAKAVPLWQRAQEEANGRLGGADWPALRSQLRALG